MVAELRLVVRLRRIVERLARDARVGIGVMIVLGIVGAVMV